MSPQQHPKVTSLVNGMVMPLFGPSRLGRQIEFESNSSSEKSLTAWFGAGHLIACYAILLASGELIVKMVEGGWL